MTRRGFTDLAEGLLELFADAASMASVESVLQDAQLRRRKKKTDPEENKKYNKAYMARMRQDPEFRAIEAIKQKERNRVKRADPAYRAKELERVKAYVDANREKVRERNREHMRRARAAKKLAPR